MRDLKARRQRRLHVLKSGQEVMDFLPASCSFVFNASCIPARCTDSSLLRERLWLCIRAAEAAAIGDKEENHGQRNGDIVRHGLCGDQ